MNLICHNIWDIYIYILYIYIYTYIHTYIYISLPLTFIFFNMVKTTNQLFDSRISGAWQHGGHGLPEPGNGQRLPKAQSGRHHNRGLVGTVAEMTHFKWSLVNL